MGENFTDITIGEDALPATFNSRLSELDGAIGKNNSAVVDPTVNDDSTLNYIVGSRWYNTSTDRWFIATSVTPGAAVWPQITTEALPSFQALTISAGQVTKPAGSYLTIDTESAASTDDLDNIFGVREVGDKIYVKAANDARTVVIKHGTGNLRTPHGLDIALTDTARLCVCVYEGTNWLVYSDTVVPTWGQPEIASMMHPFSDVLVGASMTKSYDFATSRFQLYGQQPSGTINDAFAQSFELKAGTYEFEVYGQTSAEKGIVHWYLDSEGSAFGTTDWYSGSVVNLVQRTVSSVTVTGSGRHLLTGKLESKNASSAGYFAFLSDYLFYPTTYTEEVAS